MCVCACASPFLGRQLANNNDSDKNNNTNTQRDCSTESIFYNTKKHQARKMHVFGTGDHTEVGFMPLMSAGHPGYSRNKPPSFKVQGTLPFDEKNSPATG